MVGRLILIYAVVELMALIGLTAAIGFAWAVLVLLASFVLGLVLWAPMGGWQLSRQLGQLRSGLQEPRSVLSDGALVAVATGLVLVPGLVTTVFGLLLLAPPIRAAARPGLTAIAVRGLLRRVPLTGAAAASMADAFNRRNAREQRDFIDGEVIDVIDGEPPTLPRAVVEVDELDEFDDFDGFDRFNGFTRFDSFGNVRSSTRHRSAPGAR
ncbi:phage T7 F exclusion suppressor FxsA [Mycobacterium shottsii]|uniref:Membrane protein FxsA n=1 Tax=Mycobacterium shottsii TaxID=133549 RepID=A0A7I7LGB8_9MYCO|nr:FxsA family protein [Mycobacterium shottsii]QYL28935.1 phage T7 F exclusion suppressor FxsA [Mycobacterium shottsii]BBX59076.1 membrane protein FxsA [Mycobacterium shottsii]